MASPDDDLDGLDDLLSSLDADPKDGPETAPAEEPNTDFEDRPRTELLDPSRPPTDEASDELPAIRTPLPPLPSPVLGDIPEAPPELERAAPPDTLDPLHGLAPVPPRDPSPLAPEAFLDEDPAPAPEPPAAEAPMHLDPVMDFADLPARSDDPDAAFALAEAERDEGASEAAAAAYAAAGSSWKPEPELAADVVIDAPGEPVVRPTRKGLPTVVWVAVTSFAVAALGAILYSQVDAFHPERQDTRDRLSESEKDRAVAAHRRAQPIPGSVTVTSAEDGAAIWLLLGRTPLESIALPSNQVHEVRFEHPGRKTVDASVDRSHWGEAERASLSVKLPPGAASAPAFPPEKTVKAPPGPPGRGRLKLESDPTGTRAWLLIGFSPEAKLTGIETGRRYEFRLTKDGFLPAYAVVEETDWSAGRTEAARSVEMVARK